MMARIFNALVNRMNTDWYLPKYLIIVLDQDLITEAAVFDYGVTHTLEDIMKWLLINFNLVIETRKQDLMTRRPGALASLAEPRLIWVTMLMQPDYSMNKQVNSPARKFNDILKEVVAGYRRSHILKIRVEHSNTNFDHLGFMSQVGRHEYWHFIDVEMRDFDKNLTDLEPNPPKRALHHGSHRITENNHSRFRYDVQHNPTHHSNNHYVHKDRQQPRPRR